MHVVRRLRGQKLVQHRIEQFSCKDAEDLAAMLWLVLAFARVHQIFDELHLRVVAILAKLAEQNLVKNLAIGVALVSLQRVAKVFY